MADVIVVGAGPAGLAAAWELASKGLDVIVMEKGQYAGSKNVSGLLYSTVLSEMIPDFQTKAPLERPVSKRMVAFLGEDAFSFLGFGSRQWEQPPHNNSWVVYRAKFDRWLASEVESKGATILEGTVVDDLLYEEDHKGVRVKGVRVRGEEEPFEADCVILAEGAIGILREKAASRLGMSMGRRSQSYGLGVKEIWALDSQKIEERFGLEKGCGAAIEWIGYPFEGVVGGGFVYTGKETVAVGMIVKLESLARKAISPHDMIEGFKSYPEVRRLLQGGELLEYSAHIIPEGGYDAIGELSHSGLIVVGDAAGLVNASMYHEGANLAMLSGRLAAEAVVQARLLGDFSRKSLSLYERMLQDSFAMEDLRALRGIEEAHKVFPEIMAQLPGRFSRLLVDLFHQAQRPKKSIRRRAIERALEGLPKVRTLRGLWKMRRLMG